MPRVSQEQAKLNRQRVVEVAAALFRERGLHGVGVADIMASAGLTHGGFYGQFANKDALAAEAFDSALAEDRRGEVDAIVATYLSLAHVRSPGKGCPLAALANDVSREAPGSPIRARFTQGVERLASILADLTPKASRERRRQRALATLATLVGAVVLARAIDDETLANDLIQAAQAAATA
ncbi:TetR family transcriptional regulator [Methylobacterium sp. Leaf102]|jgi:TetR/AcrR family transcriptional repressor of nem operon|uniref:TetR/AcrR family transcriptional regulator n=1 Tax=unclassified Methylobacterium TaxID=2615210 RepID=UPI000700005C|nr:MULTISPECIES: TetR family transcriptional regulator [unclassified Methylobacterium]USU31545.1 TetR/AcrR family transcriptional regulator [Methylobacterium sp. OTU13CASTA1]KQO66325.1 TetR family transcriptional regulator [Methylobacterium sp. Leaf87]KQP31543.1 TetR family transcriptional regulator [Methylobacterium sp. Leaf102]KQP32531.1 TetR family transcriptional regulator [Methylobacterium sp. Leaf100]KQP67728.1 TetR family transcriptional regulator [Methylobacterium sp. Leaf112]